MKATIELYDAGKTGNGQVYYRHNATLYAPRGATPSAQEALREMIEAALETAKDSGVSYWHNSLRIAHVLVALSTDKHAPVRLFPTVRAVPTSEFLWRIVLLPEKGAFTLTGYKVEYQQKLLHRLTPLPAVDTSTQKGIKT